MSRRDEQRLADIAGALEAIGHHLERGTLDDGFVVDAVRVRLVEIGEAVKAIDRRVLESESEIPWDAVAGMRDHLTHHSFDTSHAIVRATIDNDLPALEASVRRIRARIS
ncbi:MAG TPA: HepT-like ribonuclease domain-containing protein [Acidimicrobiales bacterium]|nr:HepT-like ribonuclease domain-containing protein [Acidimicrobiales bacterium]